MKRSNRRLSWSNLGACCAALALAGCAERSPQTVDGFVLPAGDVARGQAVFVEQGCRQCHSIAGLELPPHPDQDAAKLDIRIGGKTSRVRDYGNLLTSVVNPQHVLTADYKRLLEKQGANPDSSPMPDFNSKMTVTALIDLVQFLHSRYEELVPEYRGYSYTYGP